MSSSESIGSELTGGLAGVGRIYAIFTAVLATLVGFIFIGWGIYLLDQAGKPADPNPSSGTPSTITLSNPNSSTTGWILIVLGILAIIFSWGWVYVTSRSKTAAALTGGYAGLQLVSKI